MGHGHGEVAVGVIDGVAVGVIDGEILVPVTAGLDVGVAANEPAASANAAAASEIKMKMVAIRRLMRPTPPFESPEKPTTLKRCPVGLIALLPG